MILLIGRTYTNSKGIKRKVWNKYKDWPTDKWLIEYVTEKGIVTCCLESTFQRWIKG